MSIRPAVKRSTLALPTTSQWSARRLGTLARQHQLATGITALLVIIAVIAIAPNLFAPYDPTEQITRDRLKPPGAVGTSGRLYLLGSDDLGRDILSRIVYGARTSGLIAATSLVIALLVGGTAGLVAGYRGGLVDDLIMRLADIQQAFPFILLAIAIIGVLGPSLDKIIVVLGVANWVMFARVIRSEVLSIRTREFVEAARCLGASGYRILFRHILVNVSSSLIVVATFTMASVIVAEAGLSFLSLGVPPAIPSWGSMLAAGREFVDTAWWLSTFPGLAIFVVVLLFNMLGDLLRDALDPYTQRQI